MMNSCVRYLSVIGTIVILSASARGDWTQDYLQGVARLERKDAAAAIELLQSALKQKPASCKGCIREGMYFSDYYPNYYLGRAFLALSRYEEADACFQSLLREGLIQKSELAGAFDESCRLVRRELEARKPRTPAPEGKPRDGRPAADGDGPPQAAPPLPAPPVKVDKRDPETPPGAAAPVKTPLEPAPAPTLDAGLRADLLQQFATVEKRFGELDFSRGPAIDGALAMKRELQRQIQDAADIRDRLKTGQDAREFEESLERLRTGLEQVGRFLDRARSAAVESGNLRRHFASLPEGVFLDNPSFRQEYLFIRTRLENLQGQLARVQDTRELATAEEAMGALRTDFWDFMARAKPLLGQPAAAPTAAQVRHRARLLEGYAAYFQGKLEEARQIVDSTPPEPALRPFWLLLRGVLAYSRYQLGGSRDAALLEAAGQDLRQARQAGIPDDFVTEKYFSPKLVKFYQGLR